MTRAAITHQDDKSAAISESFKQKLDEVRKIIDEDRYRKRVLLLCQQTEPRSFEEYSSSGSFRRLEKFESSTYSEVLKAVDMADNNKPVVMKIMRALSRGIIKRIPSVASKGCQSYNDILNELVVTQALSQLHDGVILNGKSLYKTHFFCLIHEIKVVSGNLERTLSKTRHLHPKIQHLAVTDATSDQHSDAQSRQQTGKQAQQQELVQGQTGKDIRNGKQPVEIKDDESKNLTEDDRMLIESLPYEYVVSVMRHEGHPLWWMMTHKKLRPEQLTSVLVQIIVGLAIAERVYLYEHRDLHVSNILIKKTSKTSIPFILDGGRYNVLSEGVKVTIIDATFSRLTHNGKVYYRDLTSTLRAYGTKRAPPKMSLQNRSYRQMVHITKNNWEEFCPKTNLIWLTYLCETLMKNEVMKTNKPLVAEIQKIRDYTLKVDTTLDLLSYFPLESDKKTNLKTLATANLSANSIANQTVEPQKPSTVFSTGTIISQAVSGQNKMAKDDFKTTDATKSSNVQANKLTKTIHVGLDGVNCQKIQLPNKEPPPAKVIDAGLKTSVPVPHTDISKDVSTSALHTSELSSASALSQASDLSMILSSQPVKQLAEAQPAMKRGTIKSSSSKRACEIAASLKKTTGSGPIIKKGVAKNDKT